MTSCVHVVLWRRVVPVTVRSVAHNKLSGTLPPALGTLSSLRWLYVFAGLCDRGHWGQYRTVMCAPLA